MRCWARRWDSRCCRCRSDRRCTRTQGTSRPLGSSCTWTKWRSRTASPARSRRSGGRARRKCWWKSRALSRIESERFLDVGKLNDYRVSDATRKLSMSLDEAITLGIVLSYARRRYVDSALSVIIDQSQLRKPLLLPCNGSKKACVTFAQWLRVVKRKKT